MRMKRVIMSFLLSLMMGGACFSQNSSNYVFKEFEKAVKLRMVGKKTEAFPHLKAAADAGFNRAEYEVAICYADGIGVAANLQEAFNYMYKAATGNKPYDEAYYYLGLYYFQGIGCSHNSQEAMKWWKKGSETEIGELQRVCMFYIGNLYTGDFDIKRDDVQAMYWYKKAAELGHPTATNNVGIGYSEGWGVEQNDEEAVKWYRKAAELGSLEAQYNMGMVYITGKGNTPIDKSIALEWFKKAAAQGDAAALMKIAELEDQ